MTVIEAGTRERLLAAGAELLAEQGVEGLSLREIARRAGVSHGAPLRHFPTLAALLSAVATGGFRDLVTSVGSAVEDAGPGASPVEQLAAAGHGYVAFALTHPGPFTLLFRPELCDTDDPDLQEAGTAAFGQLVDLVGAAQSAGWHPESDTRALAAAVWATVHGLASLWLQGAMQGAAPDGTVESLLDLQLALVLGAHRSPGRSPIRPRTRRNRR